jgi:hypothetical protein
LDGWGCCSHRCRSHLAPDAALFLAHQQLMAFRGVPVPTITIERTFSHMKFIKGYLRSNVSEGMVSSLVVQEIEKDLANEV